MGDLLLDELKLEWKAVSGTKTLTDVFGSSTGAPPTGSSTTPPSTAVIADPSDSTIGDVGPSADEVSNITIVDAATVEGSAANTPATVTIVDPKSTNTNAANVEGLGVTTPILSSETTAPDTAGQENNETGLPTSDARGILEDATGWPAWLCAAVDYFKGISTSPEWVELVEKWVSFEAHLSFPSTVSHSSSVAS